MGIPTNHRNIRMTVAYDGTDFHGFQRQPNRTTVQGELEAALSRLTGEQITVVGAGRTDAGVHALGQVVHFKTSWPGPIHRLAVALSPLLPSAIGVQDVKLAADAFHARFSARFRRYGYGLLLSQQPDPLRERFTMRLCCPLDEYAMIAASRCLVGRQDFRVFATDLGSRDLDTEQAQNTIRCVQRVRWMRQGRMLLFLIQADGFLRRMVRNIVGSLLAVGTGAWSGKTFESFLNQKGQIERVRAAPAAGLCLLKVGYPGEGEENQGIGKGTPAGLRPISSTTR